MRSWRCVIVPLAPFVQPRMWSKNSWVHSTAAGSVFIMQALAGSKAEAEVHVVNVLLRCEEEVGVRM